MAQKTEKMIRGTGYLDMLRVAAIAAVILLHVVSGTLSVRAGDMPQVLVTVYTIIVRICAIGVPLFLMISGALFLDIKKETTLKELYGKYILRMVLALILFGTVFNLMELVYDTNSLSPDNFVTAVKYVITGETWGHLWYIYMVIGIYLFMPMWQGIAKALSQKLYLYLLILLFVIACILPQLQMHGFRLGIRFPMNSIYVLYFLAGFYLHHYLRQNSHLVRPAWAIAAAFPVIVAIDTVFGWNLTIGYHGVPLALAAASLFYLASRAAHTPAWCRSFRSLTFGIYLIHPFFLNMAYKGLHITPAAWGGIVLIPVFWACTAFLSWLAVIILRKIPALRNYVL